MWNVHIQSFGLYQSINSVGEKLSEPANIIFNYQRQAVGYNGNEIELLTKYEYIDYDSKETIWNLEFSEFADKLSRKYLDKEGFVMFPQDLQKQNYHVFDIGAGSAFLMEFQGTEFREGIEVYRFSGDIEFDISDNYPEIEMPVYEQYYMTTFVEPQTGLEVSYEENFTDFVIVDNEKIPILVVSDETSDFSKDILVDSVKRQKKLFFIYEYIVTSFILLGISSTIFTIFYKQQSKKKLQRISQIF